MANNHKSVLFIILLITFTFYHNVSSQIDDFADDNDDSMTTSNPPTIAPSLLDDKPQDLPSGDKDRHDDNDDDDDGGSDNRPSDETLNSNVEDDDEKRDYDETTTATTKKLKRETEAANIDTTTAASIATSKTTPKTTTTTTPDPFNNFISGQLINDHDIRKISKLININDNDQEKKEKLIKISIKLNKFVDVINENDGDIRPEFLLDEFLPDPINVRDIPVSKDEDWLTTYHGMFSNVKMYGLKNIHIETIRANINKLQADITLTISDVFLTGNYTLDGSVSFVSINGDGEFHFNISDMIIDVFGNIRVDAEEKNLQIEQIDINMKADSVNLDLENFEVFGSELIAQTIISALSDIIFNQVKYTVQDKISAKIQLLINKRLSTIKLNQLIKQNDQSQILFDNIVTMISKRIEKRIDPLKLPKFEQKFQTKLLQFIPINISMQIENGKLFGLTTFKRMGDIYVIYEKESAIIEAEVGFFNLTGKYDWIINVLGNNGPNGTSSLAIRNVTAFLRLRQPLRRRSVPELQEFYVKNITYIWIEMKGLGVWDNLLELIINSISNVFRLQIANIITTTVSKILQQSLERSEFSFIP